MRRIYKVWNDIWEGIDAQPEPADSDASLAAGLKRLKASKEGAPCFPGCYRFAVHIRAEASV